MGELAFKHSSRLLPGDGGTQPAGFTYAMTYVPPAATRKVENAFLINHACACGVCDARREKSRETFGRILHSRLSTLLGVVRRPTPPPVRDPQTSWVCAYRRLAWQQLSPSLQIVPRQPLASKTSTLIFDLGQPAIMYKEQCPRLDHAGLGQTATSRVGSCLCLILKSGEQPIPG